MSIPYVAFGNDELQGEPECREGDMVECPHCNHQHPVEFATDCQSGEKTGLGAYQCGDQTYLACVNRRFVTGLTQPPEGEA